MSRSIIVEIGAVPRGGINTRLVRLVQFHLRRLERVFRCTRAQYTLRCTRQLILVPRAHDPSGLWQGSRALVWSNTGSPRFTDLLSNLANLIG